MPSKTSPFTMQKGSFCSSKRVLLQAKRTRFVVQCFIAIFTKGACYILCGLNQRSQARSGKVKPNNYIGGCFKIEAARPKGQKHIGGCVKSQLYGLNATNVGG